mgnify:CR=1 FL=1
MTTTKYIRKDNDLLRAARRGKGNWLARQLAWLLKRLKGGRYEI